MNRSLITLLILLTALVVNAQAAPKKAARRPPLPPPPPVLAPAPGEQLAAAAMTYFGSYACEADQSLQVSLNPRFDGYVDVRFGTQLHTMKPVLSTTGALRLEDVRGRLLLLQISQKSMLLDVKAGNRLVDDCVHEQQAENRRKIAAEPPQPGLGIDPARIPVQDAATGAGAILPAAPTQAAVTLTTAVPGSTVAPPAAASAPTAPAASSAAVPGPESARPGGEAPSTARSAVPG